MKKERKKGRKLKKWKTINNRNSVREIGYNIGREMKLKI
jgi:hypothetical protein